jgi:hypothetical protein
MATISTTLTDVKNTLLGYQTTTLDMIKTFKRGVLPISPAFPAIAVLPYSEFIESRRSNGEQVIKKDIVLEVYSKSMKREEALGEVENILNAIKNIGQAEISSKWNTTCFDFTMSSETYQHMNINSSTLLVVGLMPMSFLDKVTIPIASVKKASTMAETDSKTLIDAIHSVFLTYRTDATYSLADVNYIGKQNIPALPNFPAITIIETPLKRERNWTSVDTVSRQFDISIWTQLVDKEQSLNKNLSLTETVKSILEIENEWINSTTNVARAYYSEIESIEYMRAIYPIIGKVYRTSITYNVHSVEPLY